ncbi:MAG: DUF1924 domain-containing protein [Rhodobacteraceae bacterium]|nr:DUF1924 domain-containing protein [Paracoccaceae bacterium]
MISYLRSAPAALIAATLFAPAASAGPREAIIAALQAEAGGAAFSATNGRAFYAANQTGGKPDTPSCTTCHGNDPLQNGQTRAGKQIDPMAASVTPDRFTDPEKVAKWFRRNCNSVLGRDCTVTEKGDFIAYLTGL